MDFNNHTIDDIFTISDILEESVYIDNKIVTIKIIQLQTTNGYLEICSNGKWNFFPYEKEV